MRRSFEIVYNRRAGIEDSSNDPTVMEEVKSLEELAEMVKGSKRAIANHDNNVIGLYLTNEPLYYLIKAIIKFRWLGWSKYVEK